MKKALLLLSVVLPATLLAQKVTIVDTFDEGKFQWEEYYEEHQTASIMDGYLLLENKTKATKNPIGSGLNIATPCAIVATELPVEIARNFKIDITFLIPKITKDDFFGFVFDYQDENNYSKFVVAENKFVIYNVANGIQSRVHGSQIILKTGKNKIVNFEIQKKGPKLQFSVDKMEVFNYTRTLSNPSFGFIVEGDHKIMVDEISIEQTSRN